MEGINTGPNYRTKAYKRIQNQNWEDVGTGYLNVLRNENEFRLNIIYEGDDTTVLLDSVIEKETVYIQESGTLIVWKQQTDDSLDYAISFQSSHECQQVWQYISEIQHGSYNN
ncbi:Platinum sensitivity protein, partial [Spiromyces aspiralis]